LSNKRSFTLVLGGGNALGAYHLGACRRLFEEGMEPDRIVGTSIGAVTGAILLGNPPDRRLARLQAFSEEAAAPKRLVPEIGREARARGSCGPGSRLCWPGAPACSTARCPAFPCWGCGAPVR
jgi:predicted acylesterase/phospholipase RssA